MVWKKSEKLFAKTLLSVALMVMSATIFFFKGKEMFESENFYKEVGNSSVPLFPEKCFPDSFVHFKRFGSIVVVVASICISCSDVFGTFMFLQILINKPSWKTQAFLEIQWASNVYSFIWIYTYGWNRNTAILVVDIMNSGLKFLLTVAVHLRRSNVWMLKSSFKDEDEPTFAVNDDCNEVLEEQMKDFCVQSLDFKSTSSIFSTTSTI